jgi:hypothetical protein
MTNQMLQKYNVEKDLTNPTPKLSPPLSLSPYFLDTAR